MTMIAGVSALEAGHYCLWENGRVTRFNVLGPCAPRPSRHGFELSRSGNETARKDLEDDVHATLDQAVRMQTVSDVPVGLVSLRWH